MDIISIRGTCRDCQSCRSSIGRNFDRVNILVWKIKTCWMFELVKYPLFYTHPFRVRTVSTAKPHLRFWRRTAFVCFGCDHCGVGPGEYSYVQCKLKCGGTISIDSHLSLCFQSANDGVYRLF